MNLQFVSKKYDWNMLINEVHNRLDNEKTGHDTKHISRVIKNAYEIAKKEVQCNYNILIAAYLLHDISLNKHPITNHQITSAKEAEFILKKAGFEKELISKIIKIHYNHHTHALKGGV